VKPSPPDVHLAAVVFDWRLTEAFLRTTLRSVVACAEASPGLHRRLVIRVFTTDRDKMLIEGAADWRRLAALVRAETVVDARIPVVSAQRGDAPVAEMRARALAEASAVGAAVVFLPVAAALSAGTLDRLAERLGAGARVVTAPRLFARFETTAAALERQADAGGRAAFAPPPSRLAQTAFEHWSARNDRYLVDRRETAVWKPRLLERVGANEVLSVTCDEHPLLLWPRRPIAEAEIAPPRSTLDAAAVRGARAHLVVDSDELMVLELVPDPPNEFPATTVPWRTLFRQFVNVGASRAPGGAAAVCRIHAEGAETPEFRAAAERMRRRLRFINAAARAARALPHAARVVRFGVSALAHVGDLLGKLDRLALNETYAIERDPWIAGLPAPAYAASDYRPPPARHYDFTTAEAAAYREVAGLVCGSPEAVVGLVRAVHYVERHRIAGAFVECGVFKGANAIVMARTLLDLGSRERDIYLYDTFEGMPEPEDVDVYFDGQPAKDVWRATRREGQAGSNWVFSPLDEVKANVEKVGYPAERIRYVKGLVEDTLPAVAPERIAILRLDTDFYRSTKHELVHLFPRLERGGILILDDYGAFAGSRQATDEYFAENGVCFFLGRVDEHVRIGVKQ
jgi:hypothetical protein